MMNNILRVILSILSIVTCVLIYFHYTLKNQLNQELGITFKGATLKSSGSLEFMIIEMVLNAIVCPPMIDYCIVGDNNDFIFPLDGIFYSISLARFYLIFRLYEQYSEWTNHKSSRIW